MHPLLKFCQNEMPAMMRLLRQAVEIESPSGAKTALDRMAAFFAREFKRSGAHVELLPGASGAGLRAEFFGGKSESNPVLILGHIDTVWDIGTLRRMPFRVAHGRAYGPGILDMKAGIVCGLWALRAIHSLKRKPRCSVRWLLDADEEVGSTALRSQILSEAKKASAVLVLEPAAGAGALKTARKGVGEFKVTVHGRPAHAGINPEAGVNAIAEMARQIIVIQSFPPGHRGLTLNPGIIQGGTRTNVVPEYASLTCDARIARIEDQDYIEARMRALKPFDPGARVEVTGGINRPPMERRMAARLFAVARQAGKELGMKLEQASTGGGSDGNFTAAAGTPTLDGLGAVGDGAHAHHEHVVLRELHRRAALLAALLLRLTAAV